MKRRDALLASAAAGLVLLALMTVFAIELANTQAKSKGDVKTRVHERAVLAAALIDSLFASVQQQIPQNVRNYGGRVVPNATLDRQNQQNAYMVVLGPTGRVIAHSRGYTAQASADVGRSGAVASVRAGREYAIGDVAPYRRTGALDYAVAFPTPFGRRILVTGFMPSALSIFISGELRKIPGVKGAHNYLIDGNRVVLASTNPAIPLGHVFSQPAEVRALVVSSGDVGGHYYDQVRLANSTWRVVLAAPDGPLFASVSGLRKWVPWMIFAAFTLVALAALALSRRVLRSAEELRVANAQLEAVNKELAVTNSALERRAAELVSSNADLEHFASIASHDLQEPLRKVRTFTQQLSDAESDHLSPKGQDYLRRTNAAAERMQKLIEDLLRYSRVSTQGRSFVKVDLTEKARHIVDDLQAQIDESGAIVRIGELPTVNADPVQMRQLVQNLVSNAIKFRRPGVTPEVDIEGTARDGIAEFTVRDNGIGFEPQYSGRIFRVFERLHGRTEYPGTGIGLALCRKIAERHGGNVVADSTPGSGSTLTVTLPVDQREPVFVTGSYSENGGAGSRTVEAYVVA
jgi:signal transduction histidine kinase